jgi:hypothetical protein
VSDVVERCPRPVDPLLTRNPLRGWFRFAANIAGEGTAARRAWRSAYVRRAVVLDAACATVAGALGWISWFSWSGLEAPPHPPFWIVVFTPLVWVPARVVARTYAPRFLWVGVEEYRRVVATAIVLLAAVGTSSWALHMHLARASWSSRCP